MRRALATGLALFLLAPGMAAVRAAAGKEAVQPDYSEVTSKKAARERVRRGELVETRLYPAELGGRDDPENVIYLPPAVMEARALAIATVERQAEQDLIDHLEVDADYKGKSIVPSEITIRGTHRRLPGVLQVSVHVW